MFFVSSMSSTGVTLVFFRAKLYPSCHKLISSSIPTPRRLSYHSIGYSYHKRRVLCHHSALNTPISQGLWHWAKGVILCIIPQCPAPREPKWKVCFSTRWVRRWKSFGMTWVCGRGTRGSTELFIPSGVLWLGSTHSSCPFSPAASRRSVQSWPVCWWITWEDERIHPPPPPTPYLSFSPLFCFSLVFFFFTMDMWHTLQLEKALTWSPLHRSLWLVEVTL